MKHSIKLFHDDYPPPDGSILLFVCEWKINSILFLSILLLEFIDSDLIIQFQHTKNIVVYTYTVFLEFSIFFSPSILVFTRNTYHFSAHILQKLKIHVERFSNSFYEARYWITFFHVSCSCLR